MNTIGFGYKALKGVLFLYKILLNNIICCCLVFSFSFFNSPFSFFFPTYRKKHSYECFFFGDTLDEKFSMGFKQAKFHLSKLLCLHNKSICVPWCRYVPCVFSLFFCRNFVFLCSIRIFFATFLLWFSCSSESLPIF
jgi:hypothetical protein